MEFYIAAFRSRAHTMRFFECLKNKGYKIKIINTPREASIGCGICVQIQKEDFLKIKDNYEPEVYCTFVGWFLVSCNQGRTMEVIRV